MAVPMFGKNEKIIALAMFGDEVEAIQVLGKLEGANITYSLQGTVGASVFPKMRTKAHEIIIQILEKDLGAAAKVLNEKGQD